MKRFIVLIVMFLIASSYLFAGVAFDVGFYFPSDTDTAVMWNFEYFKGIDESIDLLFNASYSGSSKKNGGERFGATSSGSGTQYNKKTEQNFIPLIVGARYNFADVGVKPFAGVGLGWAFAWETTKQLNPPKEKTYFYNDFIFQVQGGAAYPISTAGEVYGKLYYNYCAMTKELSNNREIELNMSGIGISAGLRFRF